jgi:thioredoxin 1
MTQRRTDEPAHESTVAAWGPAELDSHLAGGRPVLVDWRAEWCTLCAAEAKVLERVAPALAQGVEVATVDVGAHPQMAERYGIQTLPSFTLFVGGTPRPALTGYRRAPEIREYVERSLAATDAGVDPGPTAGA